MLAFLDGATWGETAVDARTDALISVLLKIWPVPTGHEGKVVDVRSTAEGESIELKDLINANLIEPGTVLSAGIVGPWEGWTAVVLADGNLEVDGRVFGSPSSVGKYAKGGVTNGWYVWELPDGHKLLDVRSVFTGKKKLSGAVPHLDWASLHEIFEALPAGRWTT